MQTDRQTPNWYTERQSGSLGCILRSNIRIEERKKGRKKEEEKKGRD